ncbi:S1 RNA-binding domain-containing protein [Candidatus Uhrbacteria bacterium]|nr:S1 RNA-binding domain-containing protein [Candidatus Uhrbacteria bacterium]
MNANASVNVVGNDTEGQNSMAHLIQSSAFKNLPKVGDIIEGKVLSASKKEVLIDIPGLTTGVVRGPELYDESGENEHIAVGDTVHATVMALENERGEIECSFRSAGHKRAWEAAQETMKKGSLLNVKVLSANKGGLMVMVSRLNGFLPVSQLTPEHYPRVAGGDKQRILEKLQTLTGKELEVKIIDVNEQEGKLIVSEKKAFEEKQKDTIASYAVGSVVEGAVSGITNFGAFVRFDQNLEGLIHISELSWQRVEDPHAVVKVGDKLQVKIIGIDGSKISLSLKQLSEDPWKAAAEKYHVGQRVRGAIRRITPYGLLVELDPIIQGLAHISQLDAAKSGDLMRGAKIGEEMDFIVVSIDAGQHRLGLSRKLIDEPAPKEQPTSTGEQNNKETEPPHNTPTTALSSSQSATEAETSAASTDAV